jgi:hypothetical protein
MLRAKLSSEPSVETLLTMYEELIPVVVPFSITVADIAICEKLPNRFFINGSVAFSERNEVLLEEVLVQLVLVVVLVVVEDVVLFVVVELVVVLVLVVVGVVVEVVGFVVDVVGVEVVVGVDDVVGVVVDVVGKVVVDERVNTTYAPTPITATTMMTITTITPVAIP